MKILKSFSLFFITAVLLSCSSKKSTVIWTLTLNQPNKPSQEVVVLPEDLKAGFTFSKVVDGVTINVVTKAKDNYVALTAEAIAVNGTTAQCFLALKANYTNANPWNYDGEIKRSEVYRQSPHDVNAWITDSLAKQALPIIALKNDTGFSIAVSNSPVYYDNFTTQQFDVAKNELILTAGDNGLTPGMQPATMKMGAYNAEKGQLFTPGTVKPYYHTVSENKKHVFECLIISSKATDLNNFRKDIVLSISDHWSGGKYTDYMGALAFTVPYMNLRKNDSKKSSYWVIPSVEYSNTQYCRDAFWISTMLADSMSAQCLTSELDSVNHYAEYPLYIPIWAYRSQLKGIKVDLAKVQKYVDTIETHVKNGYYYSYDDNDGRKDFQYWNDCVAFDTTDVISYNQGLLAVSLMAAKELKLAFKTSPDLAIKNYKGLYNEKLGFYPLSMKKDFILSSDPVVGDLLSQIYFNKPLLPIENLQRHYESITKKSKTAYGYKIVADTAGNYLPRQAYDFGTYISQINRENMPEGKYQHGGSWTLYDMLFLMDSYMQGIQGAEEEIVWRGTLDFKLGATSYECINTKTGIPWKPNMGWNSAIYFFWRKLVDENRAGDKLFKSVDAAVK